MLIQDLLSLIGVWLSSRNWKTILLLGSLPAVLLIVIVSLAILGATQDENVVVANYLKLVSERLGTEDLAAASNDGSATAIDLNPENTLDGETSMLLRRVLQTQSYNSRLTFLIAQDLVRNGRRAAAKNMLRRIAPQDGSGYLPAHALLATLELLESSQSGQPSKENAESFSVDLAAASKWEGVSPELLAKFADQLVGQGKVQEAIDMLKEKVEVHPDLQLKIASLAAGSSNEKDFRKAKYESKKMLVKRIQEQEAQPRDFLSLGQIYLTEQNFEDARKVALAGLRTSGQIEDEEQSESLEGVFRRLLSVSLHGMFIQSAQQNGSQTSVNLELLEQAMKADPTNADVLSTVFQFVQQGQMASDKLLESLRYSLADGSANDITHLMLANFHLQNEDRDQALPHLEMALLGNEKNTVTLNNLAYALLDGDEADRKRGLELIERAIAITSSMEVAPERKPFIEAYMASMFDTKGQLLEAMGEGTKAIIAYENAIRVQRDKLNTRERLADAYRAAGMKEMADTQLNRISAIKKQLEQTDTKPATSQGQ